MSAHDTARSLQDGSGHGRTASLSISTLVLNNNVNYNNYYMN